MKPFKLVDFVERDVNITVAEVYRQETGAFVAVAPFATVNNDVVTSERDRSHNIIIV